MSREKYKQLPPLEFIKVHGTHSLSKGAYRTGDLDQPLSKTDIVLQVRSGMCVWTVDNNFHRDDGPAVEWENGSVEWYKHGRFHREDGPAVIMAGGSRVWYLDGQRLDITSLEELRKIIKERKGG